MINISITKCAIFSKINNSILSTNSFETNLNERYNTRLSI